ncbi:unnamed protein product [Microthlaspi erraticum]|uniref:Pollen Ole e 1 allergen and extensin family protein n=1 Tax=Microthlaspi erraticum TaxID=1685480 RepID=A0A6D2IC97_9BRAS|nr:unnamed protein product [Microthlaspi erraticum]
MAKANVFLLSIFVIASLSSLSHGLSINGLLINTLQVSGVLRCTLNSNTNAPVISGRTVFLRCAGSSTNLGQAITDPAGVFVVVAKIADTALFDPASCRVVVVLPVATCSVFPPDGLVGATVTLVSVLQTNLGNIARFTTGPFLVL